jgi:hypothetical protein
MISPFYYEFSISVVCVCFLSRGKKKDELSNLLFWQSIEDLKDEEIRGCDRHLHLCNAWNIVKRFLSNGTNVFETSTV